MYKLKTKAMAEFWALDSAELAEAFHVISADGRAIIAIATPRMKEKNK